MIKKRSFDKKVAICSRLKLIFFNIDLIKLIVAIFKLTVKEIMLFLLNQKIKKKRLKFLRYKPYHLFFSQNIFKIKKNIVL